MQDQGNNSALVINPETIPTIFQQAPFWLTWSPKPHPKIPNKTLKVPTAGKSWPTKLNSLSSLLPLAPTQGLGFAYTEDHPFICIDVDEFTEENLLLVKALDSYTEISPSGLGCHVVITVPDKQAIINVYGKGKRNGKRKRDLFISTGFVTVTNNVIDCSDARVASVDDSTGEINKSPVTNNVIDDQSKPIREVDSLLEILHGLFTEQRAVQKPEEPQEYEDTAPTTQSRAIKEQAPLPYVRSLLNKLPVQQLTEDIFDRLSNNEPVFLSPDCTEEARTPWLIIGQALHHEYNGALKGFTLWTEWSKSGNKYDPDAMDACWRSFSVAGETEVQPITIASIIKLAEAQSPSYPDVDSKGRLLGTINNFYTYLRFAGIVSATNELTRQPEISASAAKIKQWETPIEGLGLDTISSLILSDFSRLKTAPYAFSLSIIRQYLKASANTNFVNPVKDYFKKCGENWDKRDRLPELMRTISTDKSYMRYRTSYQQFLRKWLIQVVAAACHDKTNPARLNRLLVFVGDQGIGKTMWVQSLFPKALAKYCSADKDLKLGRFKTESTKLAMELSNTLICNLNEVDTQFRQGGFSDFKIFLDQTSDQVVLPYGESPVEMTRRTVFIGSTNTSAFLSDTTGNRRIEVINASHLNYKHDIDIDQLWGQIYHLYTQGEKWWFDVDREEDQQTILDRDALNARAFAFVDDTIADDLDDTFDASAPIDQWVKTTLVDIRALIGRYESKRGSAGNSQVSRNVKQVVEAWLNQIPGAPPKEKGNHPRARVFYWMPPLREQQGPMGAFMQVIEKDHVN